MARAALPGRLTWRAADVVAAAVETPRARRITLRVPDWAGHLPGQHVTVRLTAPDGYSAQRSYSLASPPERPDLDLVVERLDDGEVSPFLVDELRPGDAVELRGPIGRYFVWRDGMGGPVQLVAGGSGVVPFLAVLAHHRAVGSPVPVRLLVSARTAADVIGRRELDEAGPAVTVTLTRGAPPGWTGETGRVDAAMLARVALPPSDAPTVLVCGPNGFVTAASEALLALGHAPERIKTERFGPSGG